MKLKEMFAAGSIFDSPGAERPGIGAEEIAQRQRWLGCPAGRRTVRPDYFNSNSAISMRVVPMLRMPRVVPGSCQ